MNNKIQARRTMPFAGFSLLCLLLVFLGTGFRTASAEDWWSNLHNHRVALEIKAGATALVDKIVTVPIDLTSLLIQAGAGPTALDVRSLRMLELSSSGAVINAAVPFQFDPAPDFDATSNAVGEFVLLVEGSTPANGRRYYQVYFAAGAALPAPPVLPRISVTDGVIDEGNSSFAVRTIAGDWYYHKTSGGFSSLEDRSGNDWIGYSSATGASGDYRGIPNLVPPASGGYFHPGRPGTAQSSLLDRGPLRARIHSRSADSGWATLWEMLPTYATMTVTQAAGNYWFLYEGTPGGTLDLNTDLVVRSNGTQTKASASWKLDIPGEEWAYFADPGIGRSLYVSSHQGDSLIDMYRPMDGAMTIFGLGRDQVNALLSGERRFSVGLVDSTQIGAIAPIVRSASADNVTSILGAPQTRPQDDQKPIARALANRVSGPAGFSISVNGGTSSCACGPITAYAWDFGDGGSANGALANHSFTRDGIFTVTLTVTSATGTTATDHFAVAVGTLLPGDGPQAVLKSDVTSGSAPLSVNFDGSESVDPDGGILSYAWDFGDGADASGPLASHTFTQPGTYQILLTVTDSQGRISTDTATITVNPPVGTAPPVFHHGRVSNVGAAWKTVALPYSYSDPVVIASVRYPDASVQPVVTRVRNAAGSQFELRVQNPGDQSLNGTYSVDYTVVEAGTYTLAANGIKMEAVKVTSTKTNAKGAWSTQEVRSYTNSYTAPVVLAQIMSANDTRWSVPWARGATKDNPPSPGALSVSKHVGEDTVKTRANEVIGYLVIEAGSGNLGGVAYQAGVSAPIVAGIAAAPYSIALSIGSTPSTAVVSAAGMRGGDGGWPVLFGANPLAAGVLGLAFDEDQITDSERSHGNEQVAYLALGDESAPVAPIVTPPADLTREATGVLTPLAIGQATSNDGSPVSNNAPAAGFPLGTTVVTWSATNIDGLTGTAQQRVTVVDTTPPQLNIPANIVAQATGTLTPVTLGQATATDLFGPVSVTNNAPSAGFPVGTTTVTWTATDANGRSASAAQTVTILGGTSAPPQLKVFDINRLVTKADKGFPWDQPPAAAANGDWTSPINYAGGTLFMRAEIRSQPVAQAMKLQLCMWQDGTTLETCTATRNVSGTPGTVVTWSSSIPTMYKKDGLPLNWASPRYRYALVIKNSAGLPVSDFSGWNWNGENPDAWYPLDIRFSVVAVPPGRAFSGWTSTVINAAPGIIP